MDKNGFLGKLLKENKLYCFLFALFLFAGAIFLFFIEKGDIIFFFSDRRSSFGNLFFFYFTKLGEELAFITALLFFLLVKYRYAIYVPVLAFFVTFVSYVTKLLFSHDRPMLYFNKLGIFDQINVIDGVILNGGTNSFPSGHTMAGFALFTYIALCSPKKRVVALLLFLTALLVGISRIYLVQHFLEDVYLGAIFGIFIAVFSYYLQGLLSDNPEHWGNKSLRNLFYKNRKPSRTSNP